VRIFYIITDDHIDGLPWPPSEDGFWALVRRLPDGTSLWRKIELRDRATPASPDHVHGRNMKGT
jgi:hypothetical protein